MGRVDRVHGGKNITAQVFWDFIHDSSLACRTSQDEMHSFLSLSNAEELACIFYFHLLQKNLRISAIFNTKIITDCRKDALTSLSHDSYMHFLMNHNFH